MLMAFRLAAPGVLIIYTGCQAVLDVLARGPDVDRSEVAYAELWDEVLFLACDSRLENIELRKIKIHLSWQARSRTSDVPLWGWFGHTLADKLAERVGPRTCQYPGAGEEAQR